MFEVCPTNPDLGAHFGTIHGNYKHATKTAANVCKALNSHDALVEACRGFIEWFNHMPEHDVIPHGVELVTRLRTARAALALAEKGGSE